MAWRADEDHELADLVLRDELPVGGVAAQLRRSEVDVRRRIRQLGLGWALRRRVGSRGHAVLVSMLRELLPGEPVVTEYPIGDRQKLDVYCPTYRLGVEYHGRQHFEFVPHFHGDREGFRHGKMCDERKERRCIELGIALVVFTYRDRLDEDEVFARLLQAVRDRPRAAKDVRPDLERQRNWRREAYRWAKARRR